MNILPKKSWHVLSRPNIERVRRDEAEAKAKEEEKAQRALLAEQEARVSLMRKRARERDGLAEEEEEEEQGPSRGARDGETAGTERGHINFFTDLHSGVGMRLTNVEHEAEKKAEKEKVEKRIGLLNYLVDKEKSDPEPWYMRSRDGKVEPNAKSDRRKQLMDPLTGMKHYVSAKRKCLESQDEDMAEPHRSSTVKAVHTGPKRHSKHKHKHKKRKTSDSELAEMRKERRRREEAERARAEALMRKHHGGHDGASSSAGAVSGPRAVEEQPGRYNSQYNPHLARQW